ncbi:arginine--tRNA ligase domain-containing protein [Nonomuraea angiospora]|uniref:arginine--tRNA ligase domain-containing protein n=1 Tax=Nonomuraea angiospora TaxID=46172 RepID=UPI0029AC893F|nr:arginine--tRNA ligase [Nonomuraea angiospora]MDX3111120.1 arginine--tRNA ligase [Nonomuraea angiospora]
MNELAVQHEIRRNEIGRIRDVIRERRRRSTHPSSAEYCLYKLRQRITYMFQERSGRTDLVWELDILERSRFAADLAVRISSLLKGRRAEGVRHLACPVDRRCAPGSVTEQRRGRGLGKGIHVNLRLTDEWFRAGIASIVLLGDRFGMGDSRAGRTYVVDYSSPNVVKTLHAGHLRSTMIGHVLSNLYEAGGATVYRVNHINDFGGFGFMLEGYGRFAGLFPEGTEGNERLLMLYGIRRDLERVVAAGSDLDDDAVAADDRALGFRSSRTTRREPSPSRTRSFLSITAVPRFLNPEVFQRNLAWHAPPGEAPPDLDAPTGVAAERAWLAPFPHVSDLQRRSRGSMSRRSRRWS